MNNFINRPTSAFIAASWVALLAGAVGFMIGLWNANMPLHEKGYYLVILLYGLFSAASLQKTIRDQLEEIPVTTIYYGLCWVSMAVCIVLLLISLWNADITMSEKGFYIIKFRKIFKIDFLTFQKGYFFITRNVGKEKSILFCSKTYR